MEDAMLYLVGLALVVLTVIVGTLLLVVRSQAKTFRDFAETTNHRNDELIRRLANRCLSISEDAAAQIRDEVDATARPAPRKSPPPPPEENLSVSFNAPPDTIGD